MADTPTPARDEDLAAELAVLTDVRLWIGLAACALTAGLAFSWPLHAYVTGSIAGAVAGAFAALLGWDRSSRAIIAVAGVLAGWGLAQVTTAIIGREDWITPVLVALVVALVLALLGDLIVQKSEKGRRVMSAIVVGAACAGLVAATLAAQDRGGIKYDINETGDFGPSWAIPIEQIFTTEPVARLLSDEDLYLGTYTLIREGASYYEAANTMFNVNEGRWDTKSPLTYRQPLLTLLWVALGSGVLIGWLYAALAAASVIAAGFGLYSVVRSPVALVAPVVLASYYNGLVLSPPRLLYTEGWTGMLLVIAASMCAMVLARREDERRPNSRLLLVSAAGALAALGAMLVRELAVLPVAIMALSLVIDPVARSRKLWAPWAVAFGAFAAEYAWHASQVARVSQGDPPPQVEIALSSYFLPGVAFVTSALRWGSDYSGGLLVIGLLVACAAIGVVALRSWSLRVLAGGLTLGMLAFLMLVGTPGQYETGARLGYWGFMLVPTILMWVPLVFLWVQPRTRSEAGAKSAVPNQGVES